MNYGGAIVSDISRLIELVAPYCRDRETIDWLRGAAANRGQWHKAHGVFNHIRNKSLKADRHGDRVAAAQYLFEEICAKTLFNLSGQPAPFDADSPYWVLPNALSFARQVGVPDAAVLACVSIRGEVAHSAAPSPDLHMSHAGRRYRTARVQDNADGYVGLRLFQEQDGGEAAVAEVVFWDAGGQFCVKTFNAEVPLDVFESLITRAKALLQST